MVAARTVLYVEDNPTNVLLVERILALRPAAQLLVATRGEAGFDLALSRRPDLILLDLHLPDMNGEELLSRLQAEPLTRHIPVVVVSADAMADNIARLRAAGAVDYLTKPFDLGELLAVVDSVPTAPRTSDATPVVADAAGCLDPGVIDDLRALAGDTGELAPVVQAYEDAMNSGLDQLDRAMVDADIPGVIALAHRLKGSSASLGATRLAALLARLEGHAASLTSDEASRLRQDIDDEFRLVTGALHAAFAAS
jgi:CheY-like chemotaxis protein